jgi:hypothetical protein
LIDVSFRLIFDSIPDLLVATIRVDPVNITTVGHLVRLWSTITASFGTRFARRCIIPWFAAAANELKSLGGYFPFFFCFKSISAWP